MKYPITLCLAAIMATLVWTSDVMWGKHYDGNYALYEESIAYGPQNGYYLTQDVIYSDRKNRTITAIFVVDKIENKSGAKPLLVSGGPGYNFAVIILKSQYSSGIDSTVYIYI